jgi:carboxyl-terminal processing protease
MVRISQAVLFGVIAACLTAILGFVGGWKLSFEMRSMGSSGLVNVGAANPSSSEDRTIASDNTTTDEQSEENGSTTAEDTPASAEEQTPAEVSRQFAVFWEVWELVDREFYHTEPLDTQKMVYGAIRGTLAALEDDYTSFEEPRVAERSRETMRGSFEGIGALLRVQDGELVVLKPLRKSPAIKAGLQSDDVIIKIDGEEVATIIEGLAEAEALDKTVEKIRGPKDSTVVLTIRRPPEDEIIDLEIVRDRVPLISVNMQMIGDIAHLQITDFKDSTPEEFREELSTALAQNPRGIILDLRHNPGGVVRSSLEILGHFYEGTALYEDNSQGNTRELETITENVTSDLRVPQDIPLVVLIDERTASAAEIVAGALSEMRSKTTLIGQTSYGKGSVQNVHRLRDESSVRITVAHWFTPERTEISKVGITPDYFVDYSQEEEYAMPCIGDRIPPEGLEQCNDAQLTWGVWYLSEDKVPPTPTPSPAPEE